MTNEKFARAVKKALEEDAKRSPDEYIRDLFEAGIIDAKGRVFTQSLQKIANLLKKKGFAKVSALYIGGVPGGAVRLHEKVAHGREAEGPYDQIRQIIDKARNHEGLWQALNSSGYGRNRQEPGKKKTG